MNENASLPNGDNTIPPNAVSVYGHGADALDDFPVLKAFQQYIDTEQAKAHKRLMSVCVFFTILILAVIGVFMFIIANLRLGDGRGGSSADATIRALSDSNAALQGQVLEQARKMNEQLMNQLAARDAKPAADLELQKQNIELQSRLNAIEIEKRLRAEHEAAAAKHAADNAEPADPAQALAMQKAESSQNAREMKLKERAARLAEEEKRLHEREVKLHRRRLYPDYFDEDGNELSVPVRRPPTPVANPPSAPAAAPAAAPAKTPTVAPALNPAAALDDLDLDDDADDFDDIDDALSIIDEAAPIRPAAKPTVAPSAAPAATPAAPKPTATPAKHTLRVPAKSAAPSAADADATTKVKVSVDDVGSWDIPLE